MATRASPSFAKAAKASRSASAVRGSTALRFAERSIVTIVTAPSFATMTLIGLAPLLGSVTRRGGTCKRRARFLNRIHAGRAPLASAGHIPPRDVGPHREIGRAHV